MRFRAMVVCLFVVTSVAAAATCWADDVFPPDWRGSYGTVTAGWDYWGQPGPGPGSASLFEQSVQANPGFGGALGVVAYAHWNSSVMVFDVINGRQSVLEVNSGGGLGPVGFGIKNYAFPNPEKLIRVQVTSLGPGVMDFYVGVGDTDPGDPPWSPIWPLTKIDAIVADAYQHDDGWVTRAYDMRLEPNPRWENIYFDWGYTVPFDSVFIDQVVIDTWCVPEPSSLALLTIGIVGLLIGRRKWRH